MKTEPELRDLGMKRKDLYGSPCVPSPCCASSESDNEIVHPTIDAYGGLAKALPLKDMKPGVEYTATVKLRLKSGNFDEKAGVTSGTVALIAISDLECCDEEEDDEGEPLGKAIVSVMRRGTK